MDPFIGQVTMFAGTFAPRGWAFCDGQLLPISQNTALFSILGTTYGGDGRTTFGLPDLRSRVPIHAGGGAGPGLTLRKLGQKSGVESVTLTEAQLASHTHVMGASSDEGTTDDPTGKVIAKSKVPNVDRPINAFTAQGNVQLKADALKAAGGGQSHDNMQPFLGLNFIIALIGVFPSRN